MHMETKGAENRPYMVIDDCWQEHHRLDEYNGGPWKKGNEKFPDMGALAKKLEEKGVRPGIWVRFLLNEEETIPNGEFLTTAVSTRHIRRRLLILKKMSNESASGDIP